MLIIWDFIISHAKDLALEIADVQGENKTMHLKNASRKYAALKNDNLNPPQQLFCRVNFLASTCWQIPSISGLWVFNALTAKVVPSSRVV